MILTGQCLDMNENNWEKQIKACTWDSIVAPANVYSYLPYFWKILAV